MSNTYGKAIRITLFGESHGPVVGAVADGLPPGLKIDMAYISAELDRRRASGEQSTSRREPDIPEFISGVKNGYTEGTPLTVIFKNTDVRSSDYENLVSVPRPSHADYTAQVKYLGFQDASGGGHFSGRLTAPLVAVGAILKKALERSGITINTRLKRVGRIDDPGEAEIAVILESAKTTGDSLGGILETTITGLEAGYGEPWFDTIEGELAHAVFSIPGVKGIEFGAGFAAADMAGSEANDPFIIADGKVATSSNNSGGIQGGITNGMPVVFRTAFKPTPSIAKEQHTVDLGTMEDTTLSIKGRHDPAIVLRAMPVADAVTAIVTADMIARRFGYMALRRRR